MPDVPLTLTFAAPAPPDPAVAVELAIRAAYARELRRRADDADDLAEQDYTNQDIEGYVCNRTRRDLLRELADELDRK
jgi:hypothetical protein